MFGLILALLWVGWHLLHGVALVALFPAAVDFLYWWYLVWAIIAGLIYLVVLVMISLGLSIAGLDKLGPLGGAAGLVAGGVLGIVILGLRYLAESLLPLFGAMLLKGALVGGTWDNTRLIFGFALIIIGLVAGRGHSHSHSQSSR